MSAGGILKLVLRLELPLLERPGRFPVEKEGRRGDCGSMGDGVAGGGEGRDDLPKSNTGISAENFLPREREREGTSWAEGIHTALDFV